MLPIGWWKRGWVIPLEWDHPSSKAAALGRQVLLQPFSTGPEKTLNGTAFSRS